MKKKDSEKDIENNFCANLRKALGINSQTEIAQRLNISLARWNMAEMRGKGRVSFPILRKLVQTFGWAKVAPELRKELESPKNS